MIHIDPRERNFIVGTTILLLIFGTAVLVSSFAFGFQVPAPVERIDPKTVATPGESRWADPEEERFCRLAPYKFEAHVLAQIWRFSPGEIRVPVGSTVTFKITSKDVQHGFYLNGTNINMMVLPGEVSQLTATFDEPGEYNFICNEYCGINHQIMYGKLIVEDIEDNEEMYDECAQ
ncbi:cytochrome c oxidase subunit II [Candidatus Leptofilum sp.]|uniref:cytochrome c oxidase subunit II n=1 Tax=Candidatus Leptofilum sp. TaxID=3241576 RepID=UPI003B595C64